EPAQPRRRQDHPYAPAEIKPIKIAHTRDRAGGRRLARPAIGRRAATKEACGQHKQLLLEQPLLENLRETVRATFGRRHCTLIGWRPSRRETPGREAKLSLGARLQLAESLDMTMRLTNRHAPTWRPLDLRARLQTNQGASRALRAHRHSPTCLQTARPL